jgi:hypothetical protein
VALASATDLQDFLQQPVDANSAALVLDMATGVVQAYTRQHLEYVQDDNVTLIPSEGRIVLPERPVINVTSVAGLPSGGWTLVRDTLLPGPVYSYMWELDDIITGNVTWTPMSMPTIAVTYSHGFQQIPNDLRGLCLSVAARLYVNPASIEMESTGQAQTRYSQKGGMDLTDVEKQLANKYRLTSRTVRLTSPISQFP